MKLINFVFCVLLLIHGVARADERTPAAFFDQKFTINFKNTTLENALNLIANKAGLQLKMSGNVTGRINYAMKDSTLEDAMEKIAEANDLDYKINNGKLIVSKAASESSSVTGASGTASASGSTKTLSEDSDLMYRSLPIHYSSARELVAGLTKNLKLGESVVADDANNTLIAYSSESTFNKIQSFIALYDLRPVQILIEAQIVETTKNFARDIGVSWGDLGAATAPPPSGINGGILTPAPASANFIGRAFLGIIDNRTLELNLQAAETHGDAKVVSRPKIFTLNNKRATIHSGITYNIKTLTNVVSSGSATTGSTTPSTGGSSSSGSSIAGGVMAITSGLQFEVTPSVVGSDLVRLILKVSNSEPNSGAAVDGIPGINDNSAETSVLVKGGQTATLAGLLKTSVAKTEQGVPWLSKIPGIGWLFSSHSDSDTTTELMIFITPHIVDVVGSEKSVAKEK